MDDVTKLIRTELSVVGCNVVLTRVNAQVVFFHLGMPMVFHGGFESGYADNLEGASSSWDDVLKALAQALNAFGSGLSAGTSPSPKGLKMIIFLSQSVNSGERLIGDYWSC